MAIARFLPAIQQIKKVQDKMIDDQIQIDPTNEIDNVDEPNCMRTNDSNKNVVTERDLLYNQAKVPEVAPYKRARILIERQRKRAEILKKHNELFQ